MRYLHRIISLFADAHNARKAQNKSNIPQITPPDKQ